MPSGGLFVRRYAIAANEVAAIPMQPNSKMARVNSRTGKEKVFVSLAGAMMVATTLTRLLAK